MHLRVAEKKDRGSYYYGEWEKNGLYICVWSSSHITHPQHHHDKAGLLSFFAIYPATLLYKKLYEIHSKKTENLLVFSNTPSYPSLSHWLDLVEGKCMLHAFSLWNSFSCACLSSLYQLKTQLWFYTLESVKARSSFVFSFLAKQHGSLYIVKVCIKKNESRHKSFLCQHNKITSKKDNTRTKKQLCCHYTTFEDSNSLKLSKNELTRKIKIFLSISS